MKPIIVGTDFSKGSLVALELAVDVANRFQTDIILVWVRREKLLFSSEQLDTMQNLAEDKLQELCATHREAMRHGTMRSMVLHGKVSSTLAELATREQASLIIIGTNGASGFEKYLVGSQAVRIVQDSPCPVVTVRQGYEWNKRLERIVVPVRVNANSRQKVPPAVSIAQIFHSEIMLLGLLDIKEEESSLKTYLAQAVELIEKKGVRCQVDIRPYSNYCDTVLAYAEEVSAGMLVINTEQDRVISQLFLGTNAQQIVHKAQLPVMCIHPADYINVAARV